MKTETFENASVWTKSEFTFLSKAFRASHVLLTSRQFSESKIFHGACGDQGLLWVVQHMSQGVHTNMVVCDVHTHGLFSHSGLVCVTRRLKEKL